MITLENIHAYFSKGTAGEVHALNGVSLKAEEGEAIVIVGANGSGKSTLLNLVSGTIYCDYGKIFIDGQEVTRMNEHQRSKWVSRIFQDPRLGTAPGLTVLENFRLAALRTRSKTLRLGLTERFRKEVGEKVAALGMGLELKLDKPMNVLSGGQRQALALLMAVMDETSIMLMDEPSSALDPRSATMVMKIANEVSKKFRLTTFLVTHNMKDALQFGDRILLMSEGKIVKDLSGPQKKTLHLEEIHGWF